MCTDFKEYGEVPEMVPLNFTEDDVPWVASNISRAAGALGAEAMELRNWLLRFGYASDELRVVVARLTDWMDTTPYLPTCSAYCAIMARRLLAPDKRPGVRPVGIGETFRWSPDKRVMRAAGDQAKTACGNLQLCAGIEASIEGATYAVGQRRLERVIWIRRRQEGEEAGDSVEEEENMGIAGLLNKLTIETAGMEEEAAELLDEAIRMEV